jgi:hypothetical protein
MVRITVIVMAFALCLLGACTAGNPAELRIEPGQYPAAFAAAQETLREIDFSLDRVDAYSGVLTTHPKFSAGIARPWAREQATISSEIEDLFNRQARQARVVFVPVSGTMKDSPPDLRSGDRALLMRVEISLLRRQRPGWRLETSAVRSSTHSSDPLLAAQGMEPSYDTVVDSDTALAAQITGQVASRIATAPAGQSADEPRR